MRIPRLPQSAMRAKALGMLVLTLFGLIGLAASPAQADSSPTATTSYPQSLTAKPESPTSISVDWKSTTGAETSANGFIVAVRRLNPTPREPIGTPKCAELWRPEYERPTSAKQYATECVVDGLEVGASYEIQVVETFYRNNNSDSATTYTTTFVHGPTNLGVDVTWKEVGSTIVVTYDPPTDMTGVYSHGVTFYNKDDRAVWSCYRNVAQTGRCVFDEVVDGDYRVEAYTNNNYYYGYNGNNSQSISQSFSVERPVPDDADLEPTFNWWSTTNGQMYLNVAWNHIATASSSTYSATAGGVSCSAQATTTPQRLDCDIRTDTDNLSFPLATMISGGNVDVTREIPAPPERPKNPSNAGADEISQTSALISWDHASSSNATIYAVWMPEHPGSCTKSEPFTSRSSCRLDGLEPGKTYTANVYADSAIGRRSRRTIRVTFTTDAPPPPAPAPELPPEIEEEEEEEEVEEEEAPEVDEGGGDLTPVDPCDAGEKLYKKRTRAINKANKKYDVAVDRAIDKFEERPKKLAKKIKQLKKKRDRKVAKANATYADLCLT